MISLLYIIHAVLMFLMGVYSNSYSTTNLMYQILHGVAIDISLYWSCVCVCF